MLRESVLGLRVGASGHPVHGTECTRLALVRADSPFRVADPRLQAMWPFTSAVADGYDRRARLMSAPEQVPVPVLPERLRRAHASGRLALFCGAGISKSAGYPLFDGLMRSVYRSLPGYSPGDAERAAKRHHEYDRALHLLEQQVPRGEVRRAIIKRLTRTPKTLDVHTHLLDIARQDDGVHLVTTNFDGLFRRALASQSSSSTVVDAAPRLPIPKPLHWDSIVHLHGEIDVRRDQDGSSLVLTTGDFGAAYLTEGWASRFVAELFRRYQVLFVGYSANDVVIRYVLDTFDAGRRRSETIDVPFAFVSIGETSNEENVRKEWQARGIEPLFYRVGPTRSHFALNECLRMWAEDCRTGRDGRAATVERLCVAQPDALPASELERLSWALSDDTGVPARSLLVSSSEPSTGSSARAGIEWFAYFAKSGFLQSRAQSASGEVVDPFVGYRASSNGIPATDRDLRFVAWLMSHVGCDEFFESAAAHSGAMHPELTYRIRQSATRGDPRPGLLDRSKLWTMLTSPAISAGYNMPASVWDTRAVCEAAKRWPDDLWITYDIVHLLTPIIRFESPRRKWQFRAAFGMESAPKTEADYIDGSLHFRCGNASYMIGEVLTKHDSIAGRCAEALDGLLTRASVLWKLLHMGSPDADARFAEYATSGRDPDGVPQQLYNFTWHAFLACDRRGDTAARRLFNRWLDCDDAVFRMLAVRSAAVASCPTNAERLRALLE